MSGHKTEMNAYKLHVPCPVCGKPSLRLVAEDDGPIACVCIECEKVDEVVEPETLAMALSAITEKLKEEVESDSGMEPFQNFVRELIEEEIAS